VIQGARDWMTGNVPQHGDLDDHHIVPASWGTKYLKGNIVHTILNRTPLTAETNRNVIKERLPNTYLPELMRENGEMAVRSVLESHFISPAAQSILLRDPFTRTLQEAIENLLVKERLDLSPQLRELDERIEQAELRLRAVIATTLGDDLRRLPPHVNQKAEERIQNAAKKNAALDPETYKNIASRLEFCDLRELQDTITNKLLWIEFEKRFVNKETLATKFGQLAELRNGIRHSRTVDEITRKEGEAAILWFEQILAR
jgi:hypothetical protein